MTLHKRFCLQALKRTLQTLMPEIINTSQGAQFTSPAFVDFLENRGIRVSLDFRGQLYDNIFVERFWRSVKYEEVYLHEYQTVPEVRENQAAYFRF
jgi:putative transposase